MRRSTATLFGRLWRVHRTAVCLCVLGCALSAQAASRTLFYSAEDLPGLKSRLNSPAGQNLLKRAEKVLSERGAAAWEQSHALAGEALLLQLGLGQHESAAELATRCLAQLDRDDEDPALADGFEQASRLAACAMTYDQLGSSLQQAESRVLAERLLAESRELATRALAGDSEQAPGLESATLLAAAGLAALAVQQEPTLAEAAKKHSKACEIALNQVLDARPETTWPREPLPQLRLALAHGLGAYLFASHRQGLQSQAAGLGRSWASLFSLMLLPPRENPAQGVRLPRFGPPGFGNKEQPGADWPEGAQCSGELLVVSCLADSGTRAALLWTLERCFGAGQEPTFNLHKGSDLFFALLGPLLSETAVNPSKTLPRHWKDERAGLYLFRNQWKGADDAILALHANQRPHPHLPSFADAGSFRLEALGGRWAVQRAQEPGDLLAPARELENVVVIPGTHGWWGGHMLRSRLLPDGSGTLSLQMDATYTVAPPPGRSQRLVTTTDIGIRARRCLALDYSGRSGAPVLLVLLDHIHNGPPRRWLWHTAEKGVRLRNDGFELKSSTGATLQATIVSPEKPRLSVIEGRWTDTIAVDGNGHFLVIVTIQAPGQSHPKPLISGKGLEARVHLGDAFIRFDGEELALR